MKKIIFFVLLFLTALSGLKSQNIIAVTSADGTTNVFNTLENAYQSAKDGDYIYLPGGTFSLSSVIRKKINLIGAGHYPDSTVYTNRTIIDGSITIGKGASNTLIEGLYLIGSIVFAREKTENAIIRRCNVTSISTSGPWNEHDTMRIWNPQIINNIIRTHIIVGSTHGFLVKGNIIGSSLSTCIYHGGLAQNNIFLTEGEKTTLGDLRNVTFKNNIFMTKQSLGWQGYASYGYDGVSGNFNCTFINNLFVGKDTTLNVIPMALVNIGNKFLVDKESFFVKHSGNSFDYINDYHLKASSPGKNAGDDATDVGIYGTSEPYKASALPSNPHISFKEIPSSTLPNGTLPLKIKVSAQER